jgi:hypothetical protein
VDLPTAIRDAGVKAVLEAREIWGANQDTDVREEFISALMARHIYNSIAKPIRVEVYYTTIYSELIALGLAPPDSDIISKIGGLRADIAVYDRQNGDMRPTALIEIKKFAERSNVNWFVTDIQKGDPAELRKYLNIYAGIFVCEQENRELGVQKQALKDKIGNQITFSPPQQALQAWRWCFACCDLGRTEAI